MRKKNRILKRKKNFSEEEVELLLKLLEKCMKTVENKSKGILITKQKHDVWKKIEKHFAAEGFPERDNICLMEKYSNFKRVLLDKIKKHVRRRKDATDGGSAHRRLLLTSSEKKLLPLVYPFVYGRVRRFIKTL